VVNAAGMTLPNTELWNTIVDALTG
jgi:hypothetical protein